MPQDRLKVLAEFGAEFLELPKDHGSWILGFKLVGMETELVSHEDFFDYDLAPILMHLAQEKLEKEGFKTRYEFYSTHTFWILTPQDKWAHIDCCILSHENENKFISFWEAVREAAKYD